MNQVCKGISRLSRFLSPFYFSQLEKAGRCVKRWKRGIQKIREKTGVVLPPAPYLCSFSNFRSARILVSAVLMACSMAGTLINWMNSAYFSYMWVSCLSRFFMTHPGWFRGTSPCPPVYSLHRISTNSIRFQKHLLSLSFCHKTDNTHHSRYPYNAFPWCLKEHIIPRRYNPPVPWAHVDGCRSPLRFFFWALPSQEAIASVIPPKGSTPPTTQDWVGIGARQEVRESGKIAVKVINHYGDEVLKVFEVWPKKTGRCVQVCKFCDTIPSWDE